MAFVLTLFGCDAQSFKREDVHTLENIVSMDHPWYATFNALQWWLEPTVSIVFPCPAVFSELTTHQETSNHYNWQIVIDQPESPRGDHIRVLRPITSSSRCEVPCSACCFCAPRVSVWCRRLPLSAYIRRNQGKAQATRA